MVSKSLVLAFHGCDRETARKIVVERGDFLAKQKSYHWLGQGIYFWEDSPARAWQWALDAQKRKNISKAAVIGAVIDLGNCLNLVDPSAFDLVREAHGKYLEICRLTGQQLKANSGPELRARYLDCEVFNTLHRLRHEAGETSFDTVRAFFTEGTPLYEGSGLRTQDHIQICVRDPARIIGCFFPRGPGR
jgi:hypothetical protein